MSATDRRRSSSIVSTPAARIRRVTFASAIRSGVGSHAYFGIGAILYRRRWGATHRGVITVCRKGD